VGCEVIERLWALIGKVGFLSERSTMAHYVELVRDALMTVSVKGFVEIPNSLSRTAHRASVAMLEKIEELSELLIGLQSCGVEVNESVLEMWKSELSVPIPTDPLSPQATLFGILEELRIKTTLKSSLVDSELYCGRSENETLKKITRNIKKLEKDSRRLRTQVGQSYVPTSEDEAAFRNAAISKLSSEIRLKEVDLYLAQMSLTRGTNSKKHLHGKDKARNRDAIRAIRITLGDLKSKLASHRSRLKSKASVNANASTSISTDTMMQIVGPFNEVKRCAEAIGYLIPQQLKSFSDSCSQRASDLRSAAEKIVPTSRLEKGEAAVFLQRALYFDALASHGRAVQAHLVPIPPLNSRISLRFPWIQHVIRKAASVPGFEETSPDVKAHSCSASCSCASAVPQQPFLCQLSAEQPTQAPPLPRAASIFMADSGPSDFSQQNRCETTMTESVSLCFVHVPRPFVSFSFHIQQLLDVTNYSRRSVHFTGRRSTSHRGHSWCSY
jgi:hypothetical protein